jgi:hypothetical protein
MSRIRALKVIDHAVSAPFGQENSMYLLEKGGLGVLSPCLMGKDGKKLKKYKNFNETDDQGKTLVVV